MKTKDSKVKTVTDFLVSRGYLYAENFKRVSSINLSDALSTGLIEPRILAVLPAALLRSKRGIILDVPIPSDLISVLDALKRDKEIGPDFRGMPYRELRRWANIKTKDSRSKPQKDKRITKSFRFNLDTLKKLKEQAEKLGITETKVLEELILKN